MDSGFQKMLTSVHLSLSLSLSLSLYIYIYIYIYIYAFNWINQPDTANSEGYYLSFKYSSTCCGRPHAHHQELNNCSSSLWFYLRSVVIALLDRPDHDQQHCYHHAPKVKPEAATAVVELLMMGVGTPETCWAVNKPQVIKWRNCCI